MKANLPGSLIQQAFLLQVAVYAVLTEDPRRRFSIADPFAAEGVSLKTSIVMELCDRGSLLQMREKIWAMMQQVFSCPMRAHLCECFKVLCTLTRPVRTLRTLRLPAMYAMEPYYF